MVRTAAAHRRGTAAVLATALLAGVCAGMLSGCAPAAEVVEPPMATSTPPPPDRSVPEVPVTGTSIAAVPVVARPTRVQVPDVGIDVTVQPKGVRPDGSMDLPSRVDVAAWYEYGPAPDSPSGSTVIAAHVDSLTYGIGPFSRLVELQAGALIQVTDEAGATHDYLLRSIEQVAKAEIPLDRVFDRSGPPTLVLITCGGAFDRERRTYADNVLVTADPAPR